MLALDLVVLAGKDLVRKMLQRPLLDVHLSRWPTLT